MESFNYNHLFYFWTVAKNGSVSRASAELHVSQPTVSEQIGKLEQALGIALFERAGRGIRLSSSGQTLFSYADQMFRLGQEMREAVQNGAPSKKRLAVGIAQSVPNLVALKLLSSSLRAKNLNLTCAADRLETLVTRLALRQLDVVLSASSEYAAANVRVFSRKLASSGVSFMASPKLRLRGRFPQVLQGAPLLLPEADSQLHNSLRSWLKKSGIDARIAGEVADSNLMELFAREGVGVVVVPSIVESEVATRSRLTVLGRTTALRQDFHAITVDKHPASAAIADLIRRVRK